MLLPDHGYFDVPLRHGPVHCRIEGPRAAPIMLLIHGATVPHWEFDRLVPYLNEAGWRTLRPDLYGHGRSARPKTVYDRQLFVAQLDSLLRALSIARPEAVLGHSMGAAIAAELAARRSIRRLILVAPLLDFSAVNPLRPVMRLPFIGELFMGLVGRPGLIRRRHRRYHAIGHGELADRFREQVRMPGFWRAMLAMVRDGALGNQAEAYEQAALRIRQPLILHGGLDHIVSTEDVLRIEEFFDEAELHEFEDLSHNLLLTDPDRAAEVIVSSLALSSSTRNHPAIAPVFS